MVLIGVALVACASCGGKGTAAARLLEELGVVASRESVTPQTREIAERAVRVAGQNSDDEGRGKRAIDLACRANPYVSPNAKLGKLGIDFSEADDDVKDRAKQIYDQIAFDTKVARVVCQLRK